MSLRRHQRGRKDTVMWRHRLHRLLGASLALLLSGSVGAFLPGSRRTPLYSRRFAIDMTVDDPETSRYRLDLFPYRATKKKRTTTPPKTQPSSPSTASTLSSPRLVAAAAVAAAAFTPLNKTGNTTKSSRVSPVSSNHTLIPVNTTEIDKNSTVVSPKVILEPQQNLTYTSTNTNTTPQDSEPSSWQDRFMPRYRSSSDNKSSSVAQKKQANGGSKSSVSVSKRQGNNVTSSSLSSSTKDALPQTLNLTERKPTDVLTVQDLQSILAAGEFVRRSELEMPPAALENILDGVGKPVSPRPTTAIATRPTKTASGVAFPQPSVLRYEDVRWGAAVSAGFLGMLLGLSVSPALWLMGSLAGGFYGWETAKRLSLADQAPLNALNNLIIRMGRKLAKSVLLFYDAVNAIFFMYKTGQLSMEYYKRYAVLDKRFEIQTKVDAWNARFVEGKKAFDAWERDNEVGRKALALSRTIWLVEERSLEKGRKRQQRQSRYRLVQALYDVSFSLGRFVGSILKALTGGGSSELREFLVGIRIGMSESRVNEIGIRVGAAVAALVATSVTGALFSISPLFLGFLAVLVGVVWPSWVTELFDRTSRFFEDTRAKGRGEDLVPGTFSQLSGRFDKSRYHYYVNLNGKKRYYRTGNPPLSKGGTKEDKRKAHKPSANWPWQSQQ